MPRDLSLVPHLEQYAGVYAVLEPAFRQTLEHVRGIDLAAHIEANLARRVKAMDDGDIPDVPEATATLDGDGIATVEVRGMMTKYGSSLSNCAPTVGLRQCVRALARDPNCKALMLVVDSPGGMAAGVDDLAAEITAFAAVKPCAAYIEDMGASAAYWTACAASRCSCNPSAITGSIGTYMTVTDSSKAAEKDGEVVHVVKAPANGFKGSGVAGTPVTEPQLAEMQRMVDAVNAGFTGAVAKNRKLTPEQLTAAADGRVHVGQAAKAMGLVDEVESFDAALANLRQRLTQPTPRPASVGPAPTQEPNMATDSPVPAAAPTQPPTSPATLAEIKAKFPNASAEWLVQTLSSGATMAQAKDLWSDQLQAQLEARTAELADAKAAHKPAGLPALGTSAPTQESAGGNPVAAWHAAIEAQMTASKCSRAKACDLVTKAQPDLHAAYIAAYNANFGRKA